MVSPAARAHEDALRERKANPPEPPPGADPMVAARAVTDLFASWSTATGATVTEVDAGGVPALWVDHDGGDRSKVILYLHGGAYVLGTAQHVTGMLGHLTGQADCRALSVDYRLGPEHAFPAAVNDAVAAYTWLLDTGIAPSDIVVAGDSAGGGLALATLLAARDAGLPQPAGALPISPWVDLACTGSSWQTNAERDLLLDHENLAGIAAFYLQGADAENPLASPLHGDLTGLAPIYVQAAGHETLLDDALAIAAAAARAGVPCRLDVFPEMQHVFQYCAGSMPEADAAISAAAGWIDAQLRTATSAS